MHGAVDEPRSFLRSPVSANELADDILWNAVRIFSKRLRRRRATSSPFFRSAPSSPEHEPFVGFRSARAAPLVGFRADGAPVATIRLEEEWSYRRFLDSEPSSTDKHYVASGFFVANLRADIYPFSEQAGALHDFGFVEWYGRAFGLKSLEIDTIPPSEVDTTFYHFDAGVAYRVPSSRPLSLTVAAAYERWVFDSDVESPPRREVPTARYSLVRVGTEARLLSGRWLSSEAPRSVPSRSARSVIETPRWFRRTRQARRGCRSISNASNRSRWHVHRGHVSSSVGAWAIRRPRNRARSVSRCQLRSHLEDVITEHSPPCVGPVAVVLPVAIGSGANEKTQLAPTGDVHVHVLDR